MLFRLLALRFAWKHDIFCCCLNAYFEEVETSFVVTYDLPRCCSILSTKDIETDRHIVPLWQLTCSFVPMDSLVRHDSNPTQYSWWWVSHISPKNSKWLQENVTGMLIFLVYTIAILCSSGEMNTYKLNDHNFLFSGLAWH